MVYCIRSNLFYLKKKQQEDKEMTYEQIVEEMRKLIAKKDVSKVKEHLAYQFNITGEGEGIFYLEVEGGRAHVEPYEYYDRHAIFVCEADVLFDIINGELDPIKAFEMKKLEVGGDLTKALKLKEFI